MPKLPKLIVILLVLSGIQHTDLYGKVMILNGLSHENTVIPGQNYTEYIEIFNGSDKAENVLIYQKDYRFIFTGESFYDEPGTNARSNANWIRTGQKSLILQPGEKIAVPVQVNVPMESTLTGTYWSIIMVEKVDPPDPFKKKGFQVKSVVRYGIQIITHIGSTGLREIRFAGTSFMKEDSVFNLQVFIENTGERMLRHTVSMELFTGTGQKISRLEAQMNRTFPGTSSTSYLDISSIPPGLYNAVLIADCENEDIFGTNVELIIPSKIDNPVIGTNEIPEKEIVGEDINELKNSQELSEIIWGIQVAFSKKKPDPRDYRSLPEIAICKFSDGYRVFSTKAIDPLQLETALARVKKAGFNNAWINRIDLSQCECD